MKKHGRKQDEIAISKESHATDERRLYQMRASEQRGEKRTMELAAPLMDEQNRNH